VFTAYVDDYAEVWINGQMPRRSGYPSPATIQGPQHAEPRRARRNRQSGRQVPDRGIPAINGPISVAPSNFIFFRGCQGGVLQIAETSPPDANRSEADMLAQPAFPSCLTHYGKIRRGLLDYPLVGTQ